jgi:hypothetical protein
MFGRHHQHLVKLLTLTSNQVEVEIATTDSAGKRPPKGVDAPMHQSREAHHMARPLPSPRAWTCTVVKS